MARHEIIAKLGVAAEFMAVEVRDEAAPMLKVGFSFQLTRTN